MNYTLRKVITAGFAVLLLNSDARLLAEGVGAILKPDALRSYVATFNGQRSDDTAEGLPEDGSVTAISNDQAADWMEKNIPLFESAKGVRN